MSDIQLSVSAYTTPLLHAAKYTSSSVCGVLLGKVEDSKVKITRAIPFFHHWTTLTPMLEVALQQTELHAKKNDLKIVGWYHANEDVNDSGLPERAIHVAEIIKKQFEKSVILLIDNKAFTNLDDGIFIPYLFTNNQWKKIHDAFKKDSLVTASEPEKAYTKSRELIHALAYKKLHDFDEALEDVELDWLNNEFI